MLRRFIIVGQLLILVELMSACATGQTSGGATTQLSEADNGRALDLRVGDTVAVRLPGNPTTGYQWELAEADEAIIRQLGEPEVTPASSALGRGGTIALRFETVGAGQTTLRLIYRRPFEPDAAPAQSFEVSIAVR